MSGVNAEMGPRCDSCTPTAHLMTSWHARLWRLGMIPPTYLDEFGECVATSSSEEELAAKHPDRFGLTFTVDKAT